MATLGRMGLLHAGYGTVTVSGYGAPGAVVKFAHGYGAAFGASTGNSYWDRIFQRRDANRAAREARKAEARAARDARKAEKLALKAARQQAAQERRLLRIAGQQDRKTTRTSTRQDLRRQRKAFDPGAALDTAAGYLDVFLPGGGADPAPQVVDPMMVDPTTMATPAPSSGFPVALVAGGLGILVVGGVAMATLSGGRRPKPKSKSKSRGNNPKRRR